MSLRERVQDAMKDALKKRDHARLDVLRMAKGALLIKEKERARDAALSDEESAVVLRAEVRKRQQSMEIYRELGKMDVVDGLTLEIGVLEEFLPQQMSESDVLARVRAYVAEHPEMNHAGKLTGAMKKELGDAVDGKVLNAVCRGVLDEE